MFCISSRRLTSNSAVRLLEYYRLRDWEIGLQRAQMRNGRAFYRSIPWGGIGLLLAATVLFGVDFTLGVTQGGSIGQDDVDRNKKEMAEKKRLAEETLAKRNIGMDAIKAHREGKGPMAVRQDQGVI